MTQIKLRRDSTTNWATANSVLAQGEPGLDITTNSLKIGNGSSAWNNLDYIANPPIPNPSIEYTGVFNNLPTFWRYSATFPRLQYSDTNQFLASGSGYYWLDQNFDDGNYDLSGLTSISFNNIGGIKGYFDFSSKSEVVLTSIDMGEIAVIDEWFYVAGFANTLTSFTANNLVDVGANFEIYGNSFVDNVPNMQFPVLDRVTSNFYITWNWNSMANSAAPSFPSLNYVGNFYAYYNKFTSWSDFSSLVTVNYEIQFYQNTNNEAEGWACPGFQAVRSLNGSLTIYENTYMTSIPVFAALTRVNQSIYIRDNPQLESFPSFPILTYVAGVYAYNNASMVSLDASFLPSILWIDGDVQFQGCALNEASVDAILVKLASLDGTNGTTTWNNRTLNLNQGTNAIPSATGLDAKAILEGRGCTVNVNL